MDLAVALVYLAIAITVTYGIITVARIFEKINKNIEVPQVFKDIPKQTHSPVDDITPDYAESTVPLEQFTPSSKRPLKIKFFDDDDMTGMEEVDHGEQKTK